MVGREFPADVIGAVHKEYDFDNTVDSVVAAGLTEAADHARLPRIRCFAGSVASQEVMEAVQRVEGVKYVEYAGRVQIVKS